MPKYLVLDKTYCHAAGSAAVGTHQAGAVITYAGDPGVTLFPLCDDARRRRLAFIKTRNKERRELDELQVLRFRARLAPKKLVKVLDAAILEFDAYQKAELERLKTQRTV